MQDDGANGDLVRCADDAHKRVVEKGRADPAALLARVYSQAGKARDWNWKALRQPLPGLGRRFLMIELSGEE